jgi:HAD superfamily hydrolase (TIGR01450 family)
VLESSDRPLVERYDLVMLDLDGVVYVGDAAVPGAADALRRAREAGVHLAYVTNNASRSPEAVAEKLGRVGVEADPHDVVTSAQAAAHLLLERHSVGARIVNLGAEGLRLALLERGLEPTDTQDDDAVGIVTGYNPDLVWSDVMRAGMRIRDGLPWVASNTDLTFPLEGGQAPGHGVLVELLTRFSGVTPTVAGKPQPPLLEETIRRVSGERPLMVGDRLDTDIEGATNLELPSLLVMTGVTALADLVAARDRQRPTYVGEGLDSLFEAHRVPQRERDSWTAGGWRASTADGRLRVEGDGSGSAWWQVVASAGWAHLDQTGEAVSVEGLEPPKR